MADQIKDIYKYTIVVVDDEHTDLYSAASLLGSHYQLILTDDAEKVMRICEETQPDLILLNILMPHKSGFDLAQELKKNEKTSSIPIIFLTSETNGENIDQAFNVGGADYIVKPLRAKELQARVGTQIKLRAAEKRLRQAIDLVPHRFYAKDSSGNIVLANAATAKFYSKEVDELINKMEPPLPEGWVYVRPHEKDPERNIYKSKLNYEEQLFLPDGTRRYYQTSKAPFPFSGSINPATLELSIDVTSEKEKKEEILNLNIQLLKHSRYKDKLFSLIAHDLRTPVLNTEMSLKLLLRRIDSLTKEEIVERIKKAKSSAENTIEMLESLLDWSKAQFESMKFNPQKLNLVAELNKTLLSVQSQLDLKPVNLITHIEPELNIEADSEMLQSILRNLVSNAIKFSEENGEVIISARPINGRVHISVADKGVGIPANQLEDLKQGNLEHLASFGTKGEKGSGIGLNLAKGFIEKHEGKLEIESEEGKGSIFTFSVPRA